MSKVTQPQSNAIIIGFDSAWTDSPKAPGSICAITFDNAGREEFVFPQMVSFSQSRAFIEENRRGYPLCLVALDQPTIVPNFSGSRPVERVAASVVSFIGGGVQPANRSRVGMFDDNAPIWAFKDALDAVEAPEQSRQSQSGFYLIEVFPALALAGIHPPFAQRLCAPKYNPQNKKRFQLAHWQEVTRRAAELANELGLAGLSDWAGQMHRHEKPRKADQDQLDAAICALVGMIWRACDRRVSAMIGDTDTGYMITPVSPETRSRLEAAAVSKSVPIG
jgi:predicted RNase H-like nuclease